MVQETEKIIKEVKEEFKRRMGVLLEKFEDQVKVVAEGFDMLSGKIDRLTARVDGVENRLDGVEANIEIIKTDVEFIKNGLKRKVDFEEFEALEKRVALLEARAR